MRRFDMNNIAVTFKLKTKYCSLTINGRICRPSHLETTNTLTPRFLHFFHIVLRPLFCGSKRQVTTEIVANTI